MFAEKNFSLASNHLYSVISTYSFKSLPVKCNLTVRDKEIYSLIRGRYSNDVEISCKATLCSDMDTSFK